MQIFRVISLVKLQNDQKNETRSEINYFFWVELLFSCPMLESISSSNKKTNF